MSHRNFSIVIINDIGMIMEARGPFTTHREAVLKAVKICDSLDENFVDDDIEFLEENNHWRANGATDIRIVELIPPNTWF